MLKLSAVFYGFAIYMGSENARVGYVEIEDLLKLKRLF